MNGIIFELEEKSKYTGRYKLSKLDCVNFIEMTEGYLNKTCIFVSN